MSRWQNLSLDRRKSYLIGERASGRAGIHEEWLCPDICGESCVNIGGLFIHQIQLRRVKVLPSSEMTEEELVLLLPRFSPSFGFRKGDVSRREHHHSCISRDGKRSRDRFAARHLDALLLDRGTVPSVVSCLYIKRGYRAFLRSR